MTFVCIMAGGLAVLAGIIVLGIISSRNDGWKDDV